MPGSIYIHKILIILPVTQNLDVLWTNDEKLFFNVI